MPDRDEYNRVKTNARGYASMTPLKVIGSVLLLGSFVTGIWFAGTYAANHDHAAAGTSTTTTTTSEDMSAGNDTVTIQFVNGNNDTAADDGDGDFISLGRRRLLSVDSLHRGRPQAVATGTSLHSLQYFITNIMICPSILTTGTGWFPNGTCVELYARQDAQLLYDTFGVAEALNRTDGYIDMVRRHQTLAARPIPDSAYGMAFNYVTIGWLRPIKINATLTSYLGTMLYTKPGVSTGAQGGFNGTFTLADEDMTTPPAKMTAVAPPNGGAWARLAQPITLTRGTNITLTLAFNPDNIVYGTVAPEGWNNCTSGLCDGSQHGIDVPALAMNPIVHTKEEQVWKETYLVHVTDPEYDLRHELYYTDTAPDSIWAVDTSLHWTFAQADNGTYFGASQSFEVRTNGTHWDFLSWNKAPVIGEFRRLADVGDSGLAIMSCFHGSCKNNHTGPSLESPRIAVAYELAARTRVV